MHTYLKSALLAIAAIWGLATLSVAHAQDIHWSHPQPLNDYAHRDAWENVQSKLATDGNGTVVSAWINPGGIAIARSTDNGSTWQQVLGSQTASLHLTHSVDVAYAGEQTWVAMWIEENAAGDFTLYTSRSTDHGQIWSSPAAILFDDSLRLEVDMAGDGAGTVMATIESRILRSADFGQTWAEQPSQVYPTLADIEHPKSRITYNGAGVWAHAYANRFDVSPFPGSQLWSGLLRVAISVDGGNHWSIKKVVNNLAFNIEDLQDVAAFESNIAVLFKQYYSDELKLVIASTIDNGNNWSDHRIIGPTTTEADAVLAAGENRWLLLQENQALSNLSILKSEDKTSTWDPVTPVLAPSPKKDPSALALSTGDFLLTSDQFQKVNPAYVGLDWDVKIDRLPSASTSASSIGFINPGADTDLPFINDKDVDLASSPHGTVVAVWTAAGLPTTPINRESDIFFARSENGGLSWSNSAPLDSNYATELRDDEMPTVLHVGGTTWYVYWYNRYSRSVDDGRTWSSPASLAPDNEFIYFQAASNGAGLLLRNFNHSISRSTDGGLSWSEPTLTDELLTDPIHVSGSQWRVSGSNGTYISTDDGITWQNIMVHGGARALVSDGSGTVIYINARTHNSPPPNWIYEVVGFRSTDGGRTWSLFEIDRRPIAGHANLKADVTAVGNGRWVATWHIPSVLSDLDSPDTIMYSVSYDNGLTWRNPQQVRGQNPNVGNVWPSLTAVGENAVLAWHTLIEKSSEELSARPFPNNDGDIYFVTLASQHLEPRLNINLKFNKADKDSIKASGQIEIPAGFNPLGMEVLVNIGGVERTFVMDAKGRGNMGTDNLRLKFKSKKGVVEAQTAKLQIKLKNGSFADELLDEGLVDADTTAAVSVDVDIQFGQDSAGGDVPLLYKAKVGKSGKAKR